MASFRTHLLLAALIALSGCNAMTSTEGGNAAKQPQVVIKTNQGTVVVALHPEKVPLTVENFKAYVAADYYTGLVFHRSIPGFMIQGGGFDANLQPKERLPREPVANESHLGGSNRRGTLAMARTSDPNSATSQFFINVVDNPRLDHKAGPPPQPGYTVFGEVVEGLETVDKWVALPTRCPSSQGKCDENLPNGLRDVPKSPIIIESVKLRP